MTTETILVTGGCGFIGSNLVDKLILDGYRVKVIDNLSADADKFYFNEKAEYHNEDILNASIVDSLMKGCNKVFHLAAESRIGPSIENPGKSCEVNFVGTNNLLAAARRHNIKSFVYSSTSACYGLSNNLPQKETDKIDNLNPYSVSKYAGEDLCKMYHTLWGLNTVSLRYFNVYGERMPSRGQYAPVIGVFLKQKNSNHDLTIVGDGLQSRDFVHVQDVVSANLAVANSAKCFGHSYNVGSGKAYTVLDIAKTISKNYIFVPPRQGEARNTLADTAKLKNDSSWSSKYDVIEWIKNQL